MTTKTSKYDYDYKYFSKDNPNYVEGYSLRDRYKKYKDVLQNIKNHCPQPILDAGCGPGYLVHHMRRMGIEAYGCDFSEKALQLATPQSKRYLRVANITNLPYKDKSFGTTVSYHVLEHLTKKDINMAIAEITRVTLNMIYMIIPTSDGIIEKDHIKRKQILEDPYHITIVPRKWWINKFEKFNWQENPELVSKFDRKKYGWVFVFNRS